MINPSRGSFAISTRDTATLLLGRDRYFIGFAFLFSVAVNLLMLTGPLFMLQVYDRVLGSRSEETLAALLILVLILYGLMWLLDFARTRLLARYGARLLVALDPAVFTGELCEPAVDPRNMTRQLDAVQALFGSPGFVALFDLPFTPLFILVIFVFHTWLGAFALVGGLLLVGIALTNQWLTSQRVSAAQKAGDVAHRFGQDVLAASELVRSQGMTEPVVHRWTSLRQEALGQSMIAVDWTGAFSSFTRAFRLSLQSLVLALGAWLVLQGEVTAGAMVAASILLGRALAPVEQILGRWPQIAQGLAGWRAVKNFRDNMELPRVRTRLPRPEGRIDVKSLTVTTRPGSPPILYNVSFSVQPGEALGVIGKSGSGKTTIARSLLGLITPNIGEVRLGGALIFHYSPADLGRHIGYLPQDPMLITGTVAENICRMAMAPDSSAVVEAAQKAKVHDLILSLPEGYDTRLDGNAIGLSGGQRQRIALARALYGNPMLLVLDEPNSALDQDGSDALNAAIRQTKSERRSAVIMTHRPVAISECDRLLVVEAGRVSAIGPRDEVLRNAIRNADGVHQTMQRGTGS